MTQKLSAVLVALFSSSMAFADSAPAAWQGNAAVSLSRAAGNTSNTIFSAAVDEARTTEANKISVYGSALYGNSQGKKTADKVRASSRYDHNLSGDYFGFGLVELEKDSLANLNLRSGVGAGLGYHVIKNDNNTFDVFGGAGYSQSNLIIGNKISGAELLLGEESTHKISDATRFKQKLSYTPSMQTAGQYRAMFEAGIVTDIANNIGLSLSLQDKYSSAVGAGVKNNDVFLLTGLNMKF